MMNVLNSKIHAWIDYIFGIAVIASPWAFHFDQHETAKDTTIMVGLFTLLMAFVTAYEGGFIKAIPFNIHLIIDVLIALFLGLSPWLFKFDDIIFWPHLIFGIAGLLVVIFTKRKV